MLYYLSGLPQETSCTMPRTSQNSRLAVGDENISIEEQKSFQILLNRTLRALYRGRYAGANTFTNINTLTLLEIKRVWDRQSGKCVYTNIDLVLPGTPHWKSSPQYKRASVDRIDSNGGYIKENIQIVSQSINYAKNTMTHDQMMEMIRFIKFS